jgi:hypothetical protein
MTVNNRMLSEAVNAVSRRRSEIGVLVRDIIYRIAAIERDLRDLKTKETLSGATTAAPLTVTTVSTTYTVLTTDDVVLCDTTGGAFTVTLYAATSGGSVSIKNIGASALTIDGDGAETIDGSLTQILSLYDAADLVSDGSNWFIV